jgi:ABC-type Na+ transport system ATPase subunit NatA
MIEAQDLAKRFNGVQAVRHVSFTAPDSRITGFSGRTAPARPRRFA